MSARSMIRNHRRETRRHRRAKRLAAGAIAVAGTALAGAPAAQAANYEVTNLNDSGNGSLRDAIDHANVDADPDTITFASGLSGEITLTSGELEVQAAVTITGPGPDVLTISGDDNFRIFEMVADFTGSPRDPVTVSGLTLTKGGDSAIYTRYTDLTLDDVTITASTGGTGGAIDVESSPVTITDSTFSGNEADEGGFMYTDGVNANDDDEDTITIQNSVIEDNTSNWSGGALYVDNATGGDVLIVGSTFRGNKTPISGSKGGALFFYGSKGLVTIRDTTLTGNISNGTGGAIHFDSDYYEDGLVVENTTITGNVAANQGGGIYVQNDGQDPVTIRNSTIAGNEAGIADGGGGIYRWDFPVGVSSTIVADNLANGAPQDLAEWSSASDSFVVGNSLIETPGTATIDAQPAGTNQTGTDPQLEDLADNGGPTETMALPLTSPAIDAGVSNGLPTDQRGLNRTVDEPSVPNAPGSDGTDVGAFELDAHLAGAKLKAKKKQKQKGKKIVVKVSAGAAEQVDVVATGSVKVKKKKMAFKRVTRSVAAGKKASLKLKPKSKKATKKIVKFLKRKKKAKAKIKVAFTDQAGNKATKSAKVTLVAKKKKKK